MINPKLLGFRNRYAYFFQPHFGKNIALGEAALLQALRGRASREAGTTTVLDLDYRIWIRHRGGIGHRGGHGGVGVLIIILGFQVFSFFLSLFNIMSNLIHSPYTIHTWAIHHLYLGYGVSMAKILIIWRAGMALFGKIGKMSGFRKNRKLMINALPRPFPVISPSMPYPFPSAPRLCPRPPPVYALSIPRLAPSMLRL